MTTERWLAGRCDRAKGLDSAAMWSELLGEMDEAAK